jgi:hypothetical protein
MKSIKSVGSEITFFTIYFVIAAFALFRVYSLGPNTYEQGIMYTAAVAAHDGLLPNRDFFMQYGPISSLIQGSWMQLFGTNLLQLQFSTLFALSLLVMLLFLILRRVTTALVSAYLSILWLMSGPHGAPWPSLWSNLFAIGGTLLIFFSFEHAFVWSKNKHLICLMIGNLLLVLGAFTRIHIFVVIALIFIRIITLSNSRLIIKKYFFLTHSVSLLLFLYVLNAKGVLIPWFKQCIIWAATAYVGKGPGLSLSRIGDASFIILIPLLIIFFIFTIDRIYFRLNNLKSLNKILIRLVLISGALISLVSIYILQFSVSSPPFTLLNPNVFLVTLSQKFFFFFTFAIVCTFILTFVVRIAVGIRRKVDSFTLLDCLGLGLFTQLYPLHDAYHIFVVTPGLLISIIYSYRNLSFINLKIIVDFLEGKGRLLGKFLLTLLILQNLVLGLRTDYRFKEGILEGVYSRSYSSYVLEGRMNRKWAKELENSLSALSKIQVKGNIHFFCKEGLFSAAGGTYLPADEFYVDWGPIPEKRKSTKYVYYCGLSRDELSVLLAKGFNPVSITKFPKNAMSESGELYYALLMRD